MPSQIELARTIAASLDWFLTTSHKCHVEAWDNFSFYAPLLSLIDDGSLEERHVTQYRIDSFVGASTVEKLYLSLAKTNPIIGAEIKSRLEAFCREVCRFQDEITLQVRQWDYDIGFECSGGIPGDLRSVVGDELIEQLEKLRDESAAIKRLVDLIAIGSLADASDDKKDFSIPSDRRSKPMTKIEALNYIGWPAHAQTDRQARDWFNGAIRDGEYRCEKIHAKSFVFHVDDFPAECRQEIKKT